jgi:hypothetical protein
MIESYWYQRPACLTIFSSLAGRCSSIDTLAARQLSNRFGIHYEYLKPMSNGFYFASIILIGCYQSPYGAAKKCSWAGRVDFIQIGLLDRRKFVFLNDSYCHLFPF